MLVRAINGADSIFEVSFMTAMSRDAASAAKTEAAPIIDTLQD